MALPWPHGASTLPRPLPAVTPTAPSPATADPGTADPGTADTATSARRWAPELLERARHVALSPVTALVVMLLGLALLFVLPLVGLPFVAVVVLPAVVYHLQADQRPHLRSTRG